MVLTFFEHSFLKNCIILSNHVKSILHLCQTGCKNQQQKKDQIVIVRGEGGGGKCVLLILGFLK